MKKSIGILSIILLISSCANEKELSSKYNSNSFSVREDESIFGAPIGGDVDNTGWSKRVYADHLITIDLEKEMITIEGFTEKEFLIVNAAEIQAKYGQNWNTGFLTINMKLKDLTTNRECDFKMLPTGGKYQFYLFYPEIAYCYNEEGL